MAAPTFVACSTTANWTATASLSAQLPAGLNEDDLLLLPIAARLAAMTINLTSGYTLKSTDNATTTNLTTEIQAKIAGASESAPTVTTSATTPQPAGAILIAVRGWSGDLADLVVPTHDSGASQLPLAPAGTAPVDEIGRAHV